MIRRALTAALVVLLAGTASASGAVVASSVDSGESPHSYSGGWIQAPQRAPLLEVKAWPPAPVEVSIDVQCSRGSERRSAEADLAPQTAPLARRIPLTMRHADDCYVSASVYYQDTEQAGRIALKIRGATVSAT